MTFRYIGSKSRLVDQISAHIGAHTKGVFVDAFCGTGAVAEVASNLGWPVRINDHLISATIATQARLVSTRQAGFLELGGYDHAIRQLNQCPSRKGFIWREYSPASVAYCGIERRYFTEANAERIDGIRKMIDDWRLQSKISTTEERLLIGDLFSALNRVANIAGTFGCFLAKWTPQSQEHLIMRSRKLKPLNTPVEVSTTDVFSVHTSPEDLVYYDPPYTKRQYASYYHILETVALYDEPVVEGVAGLRPWQHNASDFCYKVRALKALTRLIKNCAANRILLSYSSEGHIKIDELEGALQGHGQVQMHPLGTIGRYRPNKVASDGGSKVSEYLVEIIRQEAATNKRQIEFA